MLKNSTKVSFFTDSSQDMSSSGFLPKNEHAILVDSQLEASFLGGKPLEHLHM